MPLNTDPLPADVLAAFQRGGLLEAIRLLRAAKRVGPNEAKDFDRHVRGRSSQSTDAASSSVQANGLSPGEVPRSNNDLWLLVILVVAVSIAYLYFAR